jgi:Zn-dependent M28 family amino/carboxypeptidase
LLFVVLTIIGFALPAVKICSYAVAAVILIASLPLLFLDFGNSSRGAIDNASGVGLLLHLAEVLAAHPPIHGRVNITFLITSAEELGTMGAQVFVIDHENALREQAWSGGLFVLNVDGIGVAGDMYLVSLHRRAAAQDNLSLLDLVRDSCARLGVRLRDFRLPGALFDHIPFAAAGFEAVSLITIGANSRYVHSPGDTADKLAPSGFDQAGRAALMVIERLSDMEKNEPS